MDFIPDIHSPSTLAGLDCLRQRLQIADPDQIAGLE